MKINLIFVLLFVKINFGQNVDEITFPKSDDDDVARIADEPVCKEGER